MYKNIDVLNNLHLITINLQDYPFEVKYKQMEKELEKIRPEEKTNNILITQLNAMGDLILASGTIREIRKNFPNSHITLVCLGVWKSLVEYCPYVDRIIPCLIKDTDMQALFYSSIEFCYNNLWDRQYDLAINTHWGQCGNLASFINWLSGAREIIGFDLYTASKLPNFNNYKSGYITEIDDYSSILTKSYNAPVDVVSDVQRRYWLLNEYGLNIKDKKLEIWLTPDDHVSLSTNEYKIVIGLGGSLNNKKYSLRKLSKVLNQIDNAIFVLVGGMMEKVDADFLIKKNPNLKFINYVDKLSLRQTADLISQCDLYLGNDTGTVHMAKVFDLPTITMICENKDVEKADGYGELSSFLRFSPWQANCKNKSIVLRPEHALDECKDSLIHGGCVRKQAHCINQIEPDKILEAYYQLKENSNDRC